MQQEEINKRTNPLESVSQDRIMREEHDTLGVVQKGNPEEEVAGTQYATTATKSILQWHFKTLNDISLNNFEQLRD